MREATVTTMDEFTDSEILREREDVEFIDVPSEEHQNHFEVYEPITGMAIAGVTNAEGQFLLLEREDAPHPILPYARVAPDDDWVTSAKAAVTDSSGVAVTIDDVRRVRHHTYRSGTGEETTGYDVVFAAFPADDGEIPPDVGENWTATWRDTDTLELPNEEDNDVLNDIRLFTG